MNILGIETSCDDTGLALVDISHTKNNFRIKVLKNLVASQTAEHRPWGGVVPNIAKREHEKNLPILWQRVMRQELRVMSNKSRKKHLKSQISNLKTRLDAIAVTVGPGLEPALWTGIEFVKNISKELKIPLIGVNHLEGHLYSFLLSQKANSKFQNPNSKQKSKISNLKHSEFRTNVSKLFPAVALIVSGGNTILVRMDSIKKWKVLGETLDDAAGEALDKVARMLDLPYPGGPEIERLAKKGNPKAIQFPRPMLAPRRSFAGTNQDNYNFSFSGLKTALFYYLRDTKKVNRADVAASFQEAALDVLVKKTMRAVLEYGAQSLFLSGGVAANKLLRARLQGEMKKLSAIRHKPYAFLVAPHEFNTDNAAMIAVAGYMSELNHKKHRIHANAKLHL